MQAVALHDRYRNASVRTRTPVGRISGIHRILYEHIWARVRTARPTTLLTRGNIVQPVDTVALDQDYVARNEVLS